MLFIQYLAMFAGAATATNFAAYTGGNCDYGAGSTVTIHGGGSCEAVGSRHSWEADGDNVKGYYYSGSGCAGTRARFDGNSNTCYPINPGFNVESMCIIGAGNSGCDL